MNQMQNNIVSYLIDYRHIIGLQAHEFEQMGLMKRSDRLKDTIGCINDTLMDFATFCDDDALAVQYPFPILYNPES